MQEKPFFIYHTLKIQKLPGLRPGLRWGSSRRSPRPPSRVGRAPLPTPLPLGAFGASLSGRRRRRLFNLLKRTPPLSKILNPPLYGSNVYFSILDLRKASGCINHYQLVIKFISAGLPLDIIINA